uniref:Putative replicase n=2 Tax=Streptomyces sp. EN27 TaxID=211464 RepID=Q8GGD7_9ACTN|nr:putative replicase [Streptomyces sp. EN27]
MKRLRLRDQRRRLREAIQRLTRLSGLRGCGTGTTGELIGVHVGTAAVRFAGLQSCHSVWACPICQARIRAARAVELERAALAWLKAGHGLYMATLTVPHWEHVRLASRVKDGHKCAGQRSCTCPCKCPPLAPGPGQKRPPCTCACPVDPGQLARVVEAWRGVQGGTWWVGRDVIQDGAPAPWPATAVDRLALETDGRYVRRQEFGPDGRPSGPATVWQEGFRDRWGIVGTTRTIEITWGANGWHSHAHVLIWTEDEATDARAERIEEELYNRWAKRCKAVGLPTPARGEIRPKDGKRIGKGVDVTAATREKAGAVGKYVIKLQEGGNLAMEMTRADLKVARGQKGKTALELAAVAASGNEQALDLWHEFEFATRGMQCLTWSQGLRERLAELVELDNREDDEIPEEETADTPEEPSLLITRAAWWKSIVPVYGARPDILHAGEVGGLPGVLAVLDKLGLVHGTDYGPPEKMAGPVLPSVDQLRRGQARRQASRDRRQAVDNAVYDRAPAQWAAAQEKRRATIAKQKEAAQALQPTETEDAAAEIELTQAAAEFARRKARLRQDPDARHDFERGDVEPVRLRSIEDLDVIADARPAPTGTPACGECGASLAAEMVPYGRHVMC